MRHPAVNGWRAQARPFRNIGELGPTRNAGGLAARRRLYSAARHALRGQAPDARRERQSTGHLKETSSGDFHSAPMNLEVSRDALSIRASRLISMFAFSIPVCQRDCQSKPGAENSIERSVTSTAPRVNVSRKCFVHKSLSLVAALATVCTLNAAGRSGRVALIPRGWGYGYRAREGERECSVLIVRWRPP